jgi:kynurenine 3-monooxygenase
MSAAKESSHCRVTIVGAGPAGLLAAINFLRRSGDVTYSVDLVETSEDFGSLDAAGLEKKRSWMIGLSAHGLTALRRVPGLYEEYVSKVGVAIDAATIYIGQKAIRAGMEDVGESYVVDRNYIVAALARYLNANFLSSGRLTLHYQTRVLFVDPDTPRIFVRHQGGEEKYLPYDLLIGCDGIRSAVRAAFVASHRDFQCSVADIFTRFKSVHIPLPEPLKGTETHVLPQCMPGLNGIGLPETGGKINIAMGYTLNQPCDEELFSNDASVVAQYIRSKFKAFSLPDEEFAKQWVEQDWSDTGQVHANFYHSAKLQAIIMGDAAHATSPSIGQGMNTALADAAALDDLLDIHGDNHLLDDILPAFSEARVKEGNALTSIAFYAYSMSASQQLQITLAQIFRAFASKHVPSLVAPDPLQLVGKGSKLSVAYDELTRIGRIQAVRKVNDDARRRHFERTTGMVTSTYGSFPCLDGCWAIFKSTAAPIAENKPKATSTLDTSKLETAMGA